MTEAVEKADIYLTSYPLDVVNIMAGVNDITYKNRATGQINFLWKSDEELTQHLIKTRSKGFNLLKKDHPVAVIVFCPIVGLDLRKAVPHTSDKQQQWVNNAVWSFNIELNKMRDEFKFCYPFLASPVHRIENKKHKSYYHHLAEDGLHLTQQINKVLATQIVKAFDRN